MKWLFIAAQALALVRLLWIRWPYPWFIAALALWTFQAVNVTLAPPTPDQKDAWWISHPQELAAAMAVVSHWTRSWWRYPEALLIVLTAAAVAETVERQLSRVESYRAHLVRVAAIGLAGCIVGMLAWFVAPLTGDTQDRFNQVRSWVWAYLAISMVVAELLLTLDETVKRPGYVVAQALLLMAVMIGHTFTAPMVASTDPVWHAARMAYRPLVILCCLIWATGFVRGEVPRFRLSSS